MYIIVSYNQATNGDSHMVDSPTVLIENYYMRLNELGADGLVHALRTYTLPAEFSEFVRSCDSVVFTNPCHQDARYFVILCEAARLMTLHEAIPEGLYVEVSEACGRVSFNRSDEGVQFSATVLFSLHRRYCSTRAAEVFNLVRYIQHRNRIN